MKSYRLNQPWLCDEVYQQAKDWTWANAHDIFMSFGASYGISYLNGKTYYATIEFEYEEDFIAFKLRFPELFAEKVC